MSWKLIPAAWGGLIPAICLWAAGNGGGGSPSSFGGCGVPANEGGCLQAVLPLVWKGYSHQWREKVLQRNKCFPWHLYASAGIGSSLLLQCHVAVLLLDRAMKLAL